MKIKIDRLTECFAFLPSLNLSWVKTPKGTMYFLQLGWLYWYIQLNFYKEKKQYDDKKFYCEERGYEVIYRKACKNCIWGTCDDDGNFYCPEYKG